MEKLSFLSNKNKNASTVAYHIRKSLSLRRGVSAYSFDDRYLTYILYNWLQAYLYSKKLKFNNPKYVPFIVKYLKKHDKPLFYYSSFEALKEMDDKYFQQVRRQLEKEGDTETLRNFNRTDDFWRAWYSSDDPTMLVK